MPPRVFTSEEKDKLRLQMLEQAIPLIEEYGIKHMSVEKITKKVGIGKSTFYNFFDSKEDYVSYALEHNRIKMLDRLDNMLPPGKKMKAIELIEFFKPMLENKSVYKNFTAEDERMLYESEKARGKNISLKRETMIADRILSHVEGVKEDINVGLVANYIKLIVLGYENSYLFHESEIKTMQNELKMRMLSLIFEEEAFLELKQQLANKKKQ
ncbi:MAG: TetR/AcrR family transcriptional regulator [Lachnospiraceae bacterium]|nr:TetR/AcrR family transcriptional regulator [Lachnospiraceae bacterium]